MRVAVSPVMRSDGAIATNAAATAIATTICVWACGWVGGRVAGMAGARVCCG